MQTCFSQKQRNVVFHIVSCCLLAVQVLLEKIVTNERVIESVELKLENDALKGEVERLMLEIRKLKALTAGPDDLRLKYCDETSATFEWDQVRISLAFLCSQGPLLLCISRPFKKFIFSPRSFRTHSRSSFFSTLQQNVSCMDSIGSRVVMDIFLTVGLTF